MDDLIKQADLALLGIKACYFGRKRKSNNMKNNCQTTSLDGVSIRKIYVGNLPFQVTLSELFTRFEHYGKIQGVTIVPSTPSRPTIFAFVTFYSAVDASRALNAKNLFLRGRKLYVSPADSWHQPKELPNGEIIWDVRSTNNKSTAEDQEDDEEEEEEVEVRDAEQPVVINDEATCPVSKLNDDCLHLIFNHLQMNERIVVGHVCRRWRKINEIMWHGIRKLDFSTPPLAKELLTNNLLQLYLSLCPNITSLNVATSLHQLQPGVIVSIAKSCRLLEELTIRDIPFRKRSLAHLAQYCPNLSAFYMHSCSKYHDREMTSLVLRCKNLQKIGLRFNSCLSGSWLKYLKCPLQSLSLDMYELNPQYLLQGISKVSSTLKELSFSSCPTIRCSDIDAIARMVPDLTSLKLAGMFTFTISNNTLSPITRLKNLMHLDVEQNPFVSDEFMNNLVENCPSLIHLNLSDSDVNNRLTEKGLVLVSMFPNLTHLRMACQNGLNDVILKTMSKKLKKLKDLDIMGCQSITDAGCIEIINNCPLLESINVSACTNISNRTIEAAIQLAENGSRKKLSIIAGGTHVDTDILIIKPEIRPYINVDLKATVISHYEDFYDSDNENSELSLDDYDLYDESCYFDLYSDADDYDSDFDAPLWLF